MKYKHFESEFLNQNSKALICLRNSIYLSQSLWKALFNTFHIFPLETRQYTKNELKFLTLPYILENKSQMEFKGIFYNKKHNLGYTLN